jgi:hypothetical protein
LKHWNYQHFIGEEREIRMEIGELPHTENPDGVAERLGRRK